MGWKLPAIGAHHGWGQYQDTQYTELAPLSLVADTDTLLPNNRASVIERIRTGETFYNGAEILGKTGEGILITLDMQALPTEANTTLVEFWFDIGGPTDLYRRLVSFPKGNGVIRPINFTVMGYTLDTWEANGAKVYVRSNGTLDLYDIRYVITRYNTA